MSKNSNLDNSYVENYYNTQVGALETSYTYDRWESSPVRKFEYNQTKRALREAFQNISVKKAVEIGPGDAVWTPMIKKHVSENLYLVEQSAEMLKQAQEKLAGESGITFERSDFISSNAPQGNELIVAVRCFEYFENKPKALEKMRNLLIPGGVLILVTKNKNLVTSVSAQGKTLHSDQVSKNEMKTMLLEAGFSVESVYPAVLRLKAKFAVLRFLFDFLHYLAVASRGRISIPMIEERASESYLYLARRK